MELQELATRLGLALALGFVIGLERGWKERDEGEGRAVAEDVRSDDEQDARAARDPRALGQRPCAPPCA